MGAMPLRRTGAPQNREGDHTEQKHHEWNHTGHLTTSLTLGCPFPDAASFPETEQDSPITPMMGDNTATRMYEFYTKASELSVVLT